jgi:hypothetical protein
MLCSVRPSQDFTIYFANTLPYKNENLTCAQYILLADEISGISLSQLRAVYRAGCLLRHSVSGGEEPEPTTNIPRTRAK